MSKISSLSLLSLYSGSGIWYESYVMGWCQLHADRTTLNMSFYPTEKKRTCIPPDIDVCLNSLSPLLNVVKM